jgi:hypothetical protein
MSDFDKLTITIEKLQPNSEYIIHYSSGAVDEKLYNSIDWVSTNNLKWSQIKTEMDKL